MMLGVIRDMKKNKAKDRETVQSKGMGDIIRDWVLGVCSEKVTFDHIYECETGMIMVRNSYRQRSSKIEGCASKHI